MKQLFLLLLFAMLGSPLMAQPSGRIQKGKIRSQSFSNKPGVPVKDLLVRRGDGKVNPAKSDSLGCFYLSMEHLERTNGELLYSIGSVGGGDKSKSYQLLYPLPEDVQMYSPQTELTVIVQSEAEKNGYIESEIARMRRDFTRIMQDSIKVIDDLREKQIISKEEYDKLYNKYEELAAKNKELCVTQVKKSAEYDFESLAEEIKEIDLALVDGNYNLALKLLSKQGGIEKMVIEHEKYVNEARSDKEKAEKSDIIRRESAKNKIQLFDRSISTHLAVFQNDSAWEYKKAKLRIEPANVEFLCECGEFAEIYYNDYDKAKEYYQDAFEEAVQQGLSSDTVALCHNYLGGVYNALSEFKIAEEHYMKACELFKLNDDSEYLKNLYDSYLGLGNVNHEQANFDVALEYYKKCAKPNVEAINRKAYLQGKIRVAMIVYERGDYHKAKKQFTELLEEIKGDEDIDIATINMAYLSMIEYQTTIGYYQEAIDLCQDAIEVIGKRSAPKSAYKAALLFSLANAYIPAGRIKEGANCMNEAIDIYRNILGVEHPAYAMACNQFSSYYMLIGDFKKAGIMSEEALNIKKSKFGKYHLATVDAHNLRFEYYRECAEYDKARAELDTIKLIYKQFGLLNDYNKIQICIREASIEAGYGSPKDAIRLYEEAIGCIKKTLGPNVDQLTQTYSTIADVYFSIGDVENGKYYTELGCSLVDKLYGEDNPRSVIQQTRRGVYLSEVGKHKEALEILLNVESVIKDLMGEDSYTLCGVYEMISSNYILLDQHEKARPYIERLISIVRNSYGENHVNMALAMKNQANYYMSVGDFNEGHRILERAYDIVSSYFGIEHTQNQAILLELCNAKIRIGRHDEAEIILGNLSDAVEKKFGKNSLAYLALLSEYVLLYESKSEFNKSIGYAEKIIKIAENKYEALSVKTLPMYYNLSQLHNMNGDYEKAIEYNEIALSAASRFYGKEHTYVIRNMLQRAKIYCDLNKFEEAKDICSRVNDIVSGQNYENTMLTTDLMSLESTILLGQGFNDEAIERLHAVEEIVKSRYGENSISMSDVYNTIAGAYFQSGLHDISRDYYQKSLDIANNVLGENNLRCIMPLMGLGDVAINGGMTYMNYNEAYLYYNRAKSIATSVYGPKSIGVAFVDVKLGNLSLNKGDLRDAYNKFMNYNKAVEELLCDTAQVHSRIADARINMGNYYLVKASLSLSRNDSVSFAQSLEEAMALYADAKTITEKVYGKENLYVATVLDRMTGLYNLQQCPDSVFAFSKRAAEMVIKCQGENSPHTAHAYARLANGYRILAITHMPDSLEQAKENYLKAISVSRKLPAGVPKIFKENVLQWKASLADIYVRMEEYEDALELIEEVIDGYLLIDGDERLAYYIAGCYNVKSVALIKGYDNADGALEALDKAYAFFLKVKYNNNNQKNFDYMSLLEGYGFIYERLGQTDNALEAYREAYSIADNMSIKEKKQYYMGKIEEFENLDRE